LTNFLDYVCDDSLFALWWLIALRGLRRGKAAGLRWTEVDLHEGQLSVVRQRTTAGYDVHEGPPKSATSRRTVALDQHTVRVLRQHRDQQCQRRAARAEAGRVCHDSGYVFTGSDGLPTHPCCTTCNTAPPPWHAPRRRRRPGSGRTSSATPPS
jgi:integrase